MVMFKYKQLNESSSITTTEYANKTVKTDRLVDTWMRLIESSLIKRKTYETFSNCENVSCVTWVSKKLSNLIVEGLIVLNQQIRSNLGPLKLINDYRF